MVGCVWVGSLRANLKGIYTMLLPNHQVLRRVQRFVPVRVNHVNSGLAAKNPKVLTGDTGIKNCIGIYSTVVL